MSEYLRQKRVNWVNHRRHEGYLEKTIAEALNMKSGTLTNFMKQHGCTRLPFNHIHRK